MLVERVSIGDENHDHSRVSRLQREHIFMNFNWSVQSGWSAVERSGAQQSAVERVNEHSERPSGLLKTRLSVTRNASSVFSQIQHR